MEKKEIINLTFPNAEGNDISLSDFFDDDTAKRITSDPLLNTIYRLNSEQREALNLFLNTLLK